MTSSRRGAVIIALLVADLLAFGGWIASLEWARRGDRVRLPVEGYDPRDLLSGRYVRFRLVAEREAEALLPDRAQLTSGSAFQFCLEERQGKLHVARRRHTGEDCKRFLTGRWDGGRLRIGTDRFYVDERRANEVMFVQPGPDTYVVAAISASGEPGILELVVDGKSLRGR